MNIVAFVVAFALFVGGILLMGYSFGTGIALPGVMFIGGILAIALSLAIPVHVLKRLDR
ncbi:MAG: hypothetical protein QOD27_1750 [Microbacteriaceae bacterium]|jgi:flagellar motor component MotA|nr:hypothetical protein [Microbacteriaceae bacterium]MCU1581263.1 hypothetical protein [Microbacteriaceae bacterium]MDQ1526236.1 hypothetical protein [Microbacteriaceae bacterium]MDQ1550092.1 hypothetical protein [Microbacteriaceae bacterium]MDQ1554772.1 hypothetical protein [Microbacteriaceae bacterium]